MSEQCWRRFEQGFRQSRAREYNTLSSFSKQQPSMLTYQEHVQNVRKLAIYFTQKCAFCRVLTSWINVCKTVLQFLDMSALLLSLLASLSLSPVLALSCQPGWATTGTTGENLGCLKIYPEPGWMLSYSANRRTSPPRQAVPDSWRLQGLYFLVANSNSSNSCSPSVSHKVSHTLWRILSMVGFNSLHCLKYFSD